jgi:hypothetical protein
MKEGGLNEEEWHRRVAFWGYIPVPLFLQVETAARLGLGSKDYDLREIGIQGPGRNDEEV